MHEKRIEDPRTIGVDSEKNKVGRGLAQNWKVGKENQTVQRNIMKRVGNKTRN